jgi:sugar lactone lactonase YvrE
LLALWFPVCALGGQSSTGIAAVDSATVARMAWTRAVAAMRARDLETARREVERGSAAWPTQPSYVWGRAEVAALVGDTTRLREALMSYADLGLGLDFRVDSVLARYAKAPSFAALVARHDANRAPLPRSHVVASIADSTFWPEGMDYDPRTRHFYVASVRHGTVTDIAPEGRTRELLPRNRAGVGAVLGVRVDPKLPVVWATFAGIPSAEAFTPADSNIAALVRIRINDGAIERRWNLAPSPRGHILGDLAVGPMGDVFVTDSKDPALYRLRPGSDTLERVTNVLFRSLQGLAPTPDGRSLYLADYSHGLLRVDLSTNTVTRVEDAPMVTALGCDGIAWDRGAIIAIQNGVTPPRVMRFVLDATGGRIIRAELLDRNSTIADEPTIGAIAGREFVYVANSQWEKYGDDGVRRATGRLSLPVLLSVRLPP